MNKTRILIVMDSLRFGGAEKQTIDLINNFDTSLFELHLCYFRKQEHLKDQINFEVVSSTYCLDKSVKFDVSVLFRFSKVLKVARPDIVMAVNSYQSIVPFLFKTFLLKNFKLVVITHTTIMLNKYYDAITRMVYSPIANNSDCIVFVCNNQMNYWISEYKINPGKSVMIYNGIDTDRFRCTMNAEEKFIKRDLLGVGPRDILITICAALRTEKRHVDLIDATKTLVDRGYPVKVLIVGDGIERDNIWEHVSSTGMFENVIMLGYQPDVRQFIEIADIVALCSVAIETFSIAILEAMAFEKPIVSSDIGGATEQVIDGVNGFIFPPGDRNALAAKIEAIIEGNLFETMGRNSRLLVCDKFNMQSMVTRYQQLFLDLNCTN